MTNAHRVFTRALMVAVFMAMTASGAFAQGIGIGIKGGWLFPEFETDNLAFDKKTGWQVGMFLGGNRPGLIGAMVELNYGKKGAEVSPAGDFDTTFISVPLFLRVNAGSSSTGGVAGYFLVGPQFDWLLERDLFEESVKDNTKGFEFGLAVGGGLEITRFIIELRYVKGLTAIDKEDIDDIGDLLDDTQDLKTQSWAILFGFRFN